MSRIQSLKQVEIWIKCSCGREFLWRDWLEKKCPWCGKEHHVSFLLGQEPPKQGFYDTLE